MEHTPQLLQAMSCVNQHGDLVVTSSKYSHTSNACSVQETLHHHMIANHSRPVNVSLVTREKMQPHARSATRALLNPDWGLLVYYVLLIQSQLLAASQTLHVNVRLGTQE